MNFLTKTFFLYIFGCKTTKTEIKKSEKKFKLRLLLVNLYRVLSVYKKTQNNLQKQENYQIVQRVKHFL